MTTTDGSEPKGGASIFWLVYGQIAAMLAAFSILVFLTHLFDVGLKGIIRDAFDGWLQYVRAIVGRPLQWLIDLLPEMWRFQLSDFWKDYFGVGVVYLFSFVRAQVVSDGNYIPSATQLGLRGRVLFAVRLLPFFVLLWPLFVVSPMAAVFFHPTLGGRLASLVVLSPLIYLGLLFAANAWLV